MAEFYLRASSSTDRAINTSYVLGQRVVPPVIDTQTGYLNMRKYVFECTVAGTSAATAVVYPIVPGNTVMDGTVEWTCRECDSWINAARYLGHIAGRAAIGDTIWASSAHAESNGGNAIFVASSTSTVYLLSVNDSVEPKQLQFGADIITTSSGSVSFQGNFYAWGVRFRGAVGGGGGSPNIAFHNGTGLGWQHYENCELLMMSGSGSCSMSFGSSGPSGGQMVYLKDCVLKGPGSSTSNNIGINCAMVIEGGSVFQGATVGTQGFFSCSRGGSLVVRGFDMSGMQASAHLMRWQFNTGDSSFINCKLPNNWTGSLCHAAPTGPFMRIRLHNTDTTNSVGRLEERTSAGIVRNNPTYIKTGGSEQSLRMEGVTATFPTRPLVFELTTYIDTAGSLVTLSYDLLTDSVVDLTDKDFWVEVEHLGTLNLPLSVFASGRPAVTSDAAILSMSSATWVTTGMTNPQVRTVSIAFTPQQAGWVTTRLNLAKNAAIIYVDPNPVVS